MNKDKFVSGGVFGFHPLTSAGQQAQGLICPKTLPKTQQSTQSLHLSIPLFLQCFVQAKRTKKEGNHELVP